MILKEHKTNQCNEHNEKVNYANTNRRKHSVVISMHNMLNEDHMKNKDEKSHDEYA